MTKENYRVINLYSENVKRLSVVDITPQEDIVTLSGENGQGKSSVMDSIRFCLGGKDEIDERPIRNGETEGRIVLDLGAIVVKRRFTLNGEYISVETPDGARFPEPQKKLNDLLGAISFDPLQFTRMKPDEQYKTLRGLVNLSVDIEALDAANKTDFAERTDVNRRIKELDAQIQAIVVPEDTPALPVDVTALTQELLANKQAVQNYSDLETGIAQSRKRIAELEDQIADLQESLAGQRTILKNREDAREAAAGKLPPFGRVDQINTQIASATTVNATILRADEKKGLVEQRRISALKSEALTSKMETRNAEKAEAMEAAQMPVPGLTLSEGLVMYDGGQGPVPFSQASKAQTIRISTAIAMAMNPQVRIVLIEDASLLDDTSMAVIKEMAKENGFQVWMECVKSDDPLAIHLVDGTHEGAKVREAKPKKVKAA